MEERTIISNLSQTFRKKRLTDSVISKFIQKLQFCSSIATSDHQLE